MAIFSEKVEKILSHYSYENPSVIGNLRRMLMQGELSGTGNLIILPVDQGFEHGSERSFAMNPCAYDPCYHVELAVEAGLSAFAAPLGMLEACAMQYAGLIPFILKVNSSSLMFPKSIPPRQAINSSIEDALRLGCSAIGMTVYPGSEYYPDMIEDLRDMIREAKNCGLAVVIWSYARGSDIAKDDETALDVISYGAHMACLLGANIIKVKLPTAHLKDKMLSSLYSDTEKGVFTLSERVRFIKRSCFDGKRIVVFSGGASKESESVLEEIKEIVDGCGNGSIIGRNVFQRKRGEALAMLKNIINLYL